MQRNSEVNRALAEWAADPGRRDKADKVERYRRLNRMAKKGQVLFCGSSLMEQFPVNELLMDVGSPLVVYNRGVGGFTTAEMAQVLETVVLDLEPRHVFINIGTNDLNLPDYTPEGLIGRYDAILSRIEERLPGVRLYLLAYYPVNPEAGQANPWAAAAVRVRTNAKIREANAAVRALAERHGAMYLDLNEGVTDANGELRREYAVDGIHMYGDGYMQVLRRLMPVLERLD